MKTTGFLILLIPIVGMSITACVSNSNTPYNKQLIYRPVTLTVLDAETRQPLEGIEVIVVNTYFYSRPMIIPIDTTSGTVFHMYKYRTNGKGIVEIPQFVYNVNSYYVLEEQYITINLGFTRRINSIRLQAETIGLGAAFLHNNEDDMFVRPRPEYKAGEILCCTSLNFIDTEWRTEMHKRNEPYINAIQKKYDVPEGEKSPNSFYCGHEELIFYLERFTGS